MYAFKLFTLNMSVPVIFVSMTVAEVHVAQTAKHNVICFFDCRRHGQSTPYESLQFWTHVFFFWASEWVSCLCRLDDSFAFLSIWHSSFILFQVWHKSISTVLFKQWSTSINKLLLLSYRSANFRGIFFQIHGKSLMFNMNLYSISLLKIHEKYVQVNSSASSVWHCSENLNFHTVARADTLIPCCWTLGLNLPYYDPYRLCGL